MGCDIHLHVEAYDADTDQWFLTSEYVSGEHSNYEFFAKIAGVRGKGPKPRGLPDDVSIGARYHIDHLGKDGHSHSWLPLQEFLQKQYDLEYDTVYIARLKMLTGYLSREEERTLTKWDYGPNYEADWLEYSDKPIEDYRVIFYFDN